MKQTHWTVLFVALSLTLGGYVSHVAAQQAPAQAQAPPSFVAVVDVAQLIKTHPEFTAKQETLRGEMLAEEAKFRKRQEDIVAKEKAMQGLSLKPGSPEHQKAVDEIAGLYADFEKDARSMQRRFALKNSQIMYDTYQDIKGTIKRFAKARRIAQVTDYRFFEPNPAEPQTVAEDMDQKLVWFDESLDVTRFVIQQMYVDRKMQVPTAEQIAKMLEGPKPNAGAQGGQPAQPGPPVANAPGAGAGMR